MRLTVLCLQPRLPQYTAVALRCFYLIGLLPYFAKKNQLHYLLVASLAVARSRYVDKTAALTGLPLVCLVGSNLGPALDTEQGVGLDLGVAPGAMIGPTKLHTTSLAI
jgi:hypothetical protein